jgi:hypothetical protein
MSEIVRGGATNTAEDPSAGGEPGAALSIVTMFDCLLQCESGSRPEMDGESKKDKPDAGQRTPRERDWM